MATLQTATIVRELELSVRYIAEAAEADIGFAGDVEVLSVRIGSVDIPLSKEQWDSIRSELREAETA
jgi:hypothetical protein